MSIVYDILIIGGGPSALAAAFYAQNKQLRTLMIYADLGGKAGWAHNRTVNGTINVLPGHDLVERLISQLSNHQSSVAHINDRVVGLRKTNAMFVVDTQQYGERYARSVVVASGAAPNRLPLPGIQHLFGVGLGYSITTFAHQTQGQRVAVYGVTPRTIRGVAEIVLGSNHIYWVSPDEDLPEVPLVDAIRRMPNVTIIPQATIRDVVGINSVKQIVIERGTSLQHIPVDRLFVDIGIQPNTGFLNNGNVDVLDEDGFVIVDEYNSSPCHGIFAAGDVSNSVLGEQVLIAIGDGVRAAVSAYEYLLVHKLTLEEVSHAAGKTA